MSRVFVSHAGPDRAWAEWVAWQLDQAGYTVELDLWDWSVGDSFVARMRQALDAADVVVAVCSAAYFEQDRFTNPEWEAVLAVRDGSGPRLVPVRVEKVTPPLLLRPLLRADLFGLGLEAARGVLLRAVRGARWPDREPPLPDSEVSGAMVGGPRLPGVLPGVWNVPGRLAVFTGRDGMLVELRDRLSAGGPVVVQALQGQGGVGKTQLAVEYAHRFANAYDVVWWVDAEQPELIAEQVAALGVAMGLVDPGTPVPVAVGKVKARLGAVSGWLVVFDNAGEPADLAAWLPQGPGQVLVTSRHGQWRELVSGMVEVDVFVRDESVGLLRRLVPTVSDADARAIAARMGDLPLAVAQAAGVLAETGITASQYLQELDRHAADVLEVGRPVSYPQPLAAALRLSVYRLAEEDPAAVQLLELCAMLAPEPIPLDLFTTAASDTVAEPLGAVVGSVLAFGRSVGRLVRYGLAKRAQSDTADAPADLLLHRLTQDVVRDFLDPVQRRTAREQAEAVLVAAQPADSVDPVWWPRWTALLPHLLALDPAGTDNPALRRFAIDATWVVLARGDLAVGLSLAEQLYTAWRERLGEDHDHTMRAGHNLARAYRDQGRHLQARQLDEDTLTRRRRVLGDDHPNTLASANSLAIDLRQAGEYQQARQLNEDTLTRYRRVLGDDHPSTLLSANNLAGDLRQVGEYQRARQVDEDTLARRRRVLGDDHPNTLASANNFAIDLRLVGEYEQARQLDEDTLTRFRRVLGDDHPNTLTSANNLAVDLRLVGKYQQARPIDEDTLARCRRVLGDDHPNTLRSANNLAVDLRQVGEYQRARQLDEDTLVRYRRVLGDEHPDTLRSADNLAEDLRQVGGAEPG